MKGMQKEPETLPVPESDAALVEFPRDFQRIKREDTGLAGAWRFSLRHVLETLFMRGFEVHDVVVDNEDGAQHSYYLLQRNECDLPGSHLLVEENTTHSSAS